MTSGIVVPDAPTTLRGKMYARLRYGPRILLLRIRHNPFSTEGRRMRSYRKQKEVFFWHVAWHEANPHLFREERPSDD